VTPFSKLLCMSCIQHERQKEMAICATSKAFRFQHLYIYTSVCVQTIPSHTQLTAKMTQRVFHYESERVVKCADLLFFFFFIQRLGNSDLRITKVELRLTK
jgi:hypothetical protein